MPTPSAEDIRKGHGRLTYQEAMSLVSLPDKIVSQGEILKRYMSRRSAWVPGTDFLPLAIEQGISGFKLPIITYGAHVYSQAALIASISFRAARKEAGNGGRSKRFGIHQIEGIFSEGGRSDRPFIYQVMKLSSNAEFPSLLVTARQPTSPSTNPERDHFPEADAELPVGPVCFSAMVSFRPSAISRFDTQEPPAQARFADILNSRRPAEWDPAPIADIDGLLARLPGARQAEGTFPCLEMRKVDMRAYNAGRPMHERRELMLHRLLAPLPDKDGDEECAIGGPDAHICAHAYAADRNGLLMVGNHTAEFGHEVKGASSLGYSFKVHVNAEDAIMRFDEGGGECWVQEAQFPRTAAGRAVIHTKIWSPRGVHVATMYQDGITRWKSRHVVEAKAEL
ncbi:hypothetical protein ANO14919_102620 [Xylariales sp. No.14919]|nr:hypothetical protein ANO14919_102620 [Xylariales sp. No.14919]